MTTKEQFVARVDQLEQKAKVLREVLEANGGVDNVVLDSLTHEALILLDKSIELLNNGTIKLTPEQEDQAQEILKR